MESEGCFWERMNNSKGNGKFIVGGTFASNVSYEASYRFVGESHSNTLNFNHGEKEFGSVKTRRNVLGKYSIETI